MSDNKGIPHVIVDPSSRDRIDVVVSSLRDLVRTAKSKFDIKSTVKVLQIDDRTPVDSESHFRILPPNSCFLIMKRTEDSAIPLLVENGSSSDVTSPPASSSDERARSNSDEPTTAAETLPAEKSRCGRKRKGSRVNDLTAKKREIKGNESCDAKTTESDSSDKGPGPSTSKSNVLNVLSKPDMSIVNKIALSFVLKYLALEDRKNVRLTCKTWNGVCNQDFSTCSREKLVFWTTTGGIDSVIRCIEESRRYVLNVEFHTDDLHLFPERIWKKHGHRFHSVMWNPATSTPSKADDVWWKVIHNCPQLNYMKQTTAYNNDQEILSSPLLDKLVTEKFVHRQVKKVKCDRYDEKTWSKIFEVFPAIDHFSVKFEFGVVQLPNFQLLPETVKKFSSNGAIGSLGSECFMKDCIKHPNTCVKLKELKLVIVYRNDIEKYVLPFFNLQTELEVVKLTIEGTYRETGVSPKALQKIDSFKAKLITCVLNCCPNLKVLRINFGTEELKTTVSGKDGGGLVAEEMTKNLSQLNTLYLVGFDFSKLLSSGAALSSMRTNLRTLRLPDDPSAGGVMFKFLAHLENLQCLVIPKCKLKMLEKICASQANLRTLRILELSEAGKSPTVKTVEKCLEKFQIFPNIAFSKLEHLAVWGTYSMLLLFGQFHFPELKHLHISEAKVSDDLSEVSYPVCQNLGYKLPSILKCLPPRAPNLEMLTLDVPTNGLIANSSDVDFISRLTKLQIFEFGSHEMASITFTLNSFVQVAPPAEFEKMFKFCPSLRLIINATNLYLYDRRSETVVRRKIDDDMDKTNFNYPFKKDSCCRLLPTRAWHV